VLNILLILGSIFKFSFNYSDDSFIFEVFNLTEELIRDIKVDFLISPSSGTLDSVYISKIGIIRE
jgi:hypothetical protein